MIDLHTHHDRCGHAEGTLEEVARNAWAAGVRVFAWTDHAPLFAHRDDHPKPDTQMARSQWPGYLREAQEVRSRLAADLPDLDVRIGTEADFIPGTEHIYRDALEVDPLARDALDQVLGSVHEVGSWHIYKPDTWEHVSDFEEFHLGYWRNVRAAAQSGLFDVLAHLDAIRAKVPEPPRPMDDEIDATLDCIADSGVAVEINGSGLRRVGRVFPSRPILEGLVRRDVPIAFGSDAHRAEQLGLGYREGADLLRSLGRTRAVTFLRRAEMWLDIG